MVGITTMRSKFMINCKSASLFGKKVKCMISFKSAKLLGKRARC